jgi:Homeodomain-like domain
VADTNCNGAQHPAEELSPQQHAALEALLSGATDEQAATVAKVSRSTVWRWRSLNPSFRACLNSRREEMWGSNLERLRRLIPRAVDVIEEELSAPSPNWRAAAKLLDLAGANALANIGPTTPEGVLREDAKGREAGFFDVLAGMRIDPDGRVTTPEETCLAELEKRDQEKRPALDER